MCFQKCMFWVLLCPFKILNTRFIETFSRAQPLWPRPLKRLSEVVGTASIRQQRAGKVLQRVTVTESPSHLLCTGTTGWCPKVVILAQFAVEKLSMQEAVSRASEHLTRWCTETVYFHYPLVRPWANSHSRCSCKLEQGQMYVILNLIREEGYLSAIFLFCDGLCQKG